MLSLQREEGLRIIRIVEAILESCQRHGNRVHDLENINK